MDQLHEELKEPFVELAGISSLSPVGHEEFDGTRSDSGIPVSEESSQSDGDYETCDSGPNSEKDSCADEAIDPSEQSQESTDILIQASPPGLPSPKQYNQNGCCMAQTAVETSVLPSRADPYLNYDGDISGVANEKHKMNGLPPECCSHASNPDSVLANDASLSCDKSDCPLLKEDCKSSLETSLEGDAGSYDPKLENSCLNDKHCNHTSTLSSSHTACNKGTCSLQQTSQLKHASSQAIINSMLTARKKKPVQYRSIISDIFDGKILSSVQCLTCDTVSCFLSFS